MATMQKTPIGQRQRKIDSQASELESLRSQLAKQTAGLESLHSQLAKKDKEISKYKKASEQYGERMQKEDEKYGTAVLELEEKERTEKEKYATKQGRFNQLRDTLAKYLSRDEFVEIPNGTEIKEAMDPGFHKVLFSGTTPPDVFKRWQPDTNKGEQEYSKIGDADYGEVYGNIMYSSNNGTAAFFDGTHYFIADPGKLYANNHEVLNKISGDLKNHGRGLDGRLFVLFSNGDKPRDEKFADIIDKVLKRGEYDDDNGKPYGKGDEVFAKLMQEAKGKE
ncbi:MAG: hypothetical protein LBI17_03280 [Rickettsiales bacterium]|jgi:hypothetical protein|nr:hypothetical protein [Rickettsiales bacterium]